MSNLSKETYAAHNFVSCFSIKPVHALCRHSRKVFLVLYNILIEGLRMFTRSHYLNDLILALNTMYKMLKVLWYILL